MKSEKDEFKNANEGKLKDSKPLHSVGILTCLFFFTLEVVKVSIPGTTSHPANGQGKPQKVPREWNQTHPQLN